MGRVFVTGDTHGSHDSHKLDKWEEGKNLSKEDVLIVLGDFGFIWSDPITRKELKALKKLDDKPWTTVFIDGNHENFNLLNKLTSYQKFGNFVGVAGYSIFHLKRGFIYNINGKSFLALGGAHSHDRQYRTIGKSLWLEEEITDDDIRNAKLSLQEQNNTVDYVLTHCAPVEWARQCIEPIFAHKYWPDGSEERLSWLRESVDMKYKSWLFGHYHNYNYDEYENKWACLYREIVELK